MHTVQKTNKIFGRLMTRWQDMSRYPDEQKIFVTKRFSLVDCRFLPELSGVVVGEPVGIASPAVLPLVNSGVPYVQITPLLFTAAKVRIGTRWFQSGERILLDTRRLRVKRVSTENTTTVVKHSVDALPVFSLKQRKQFFCFINNLRQLPEVKRRGSAVAIRSEDLFVHNIKTVRSMRAFLQTGSRLALREWIDSQQQDFLHLFASLKNRPIMIRLLDTALSEFFPRERHWREKNMELGNRGVRLFFTEPELYQGHLRAIIAAARETHYRGEIFLALPFVSLASELAAVRNFFYAEVKAMKAEQYRWRFGFTLETPRAFFSLPKIIKQVDFFNMGLNDFTQLMFGFSRDDSSVFIPSYIARGALPSDPFVVPDKFLVQLICAQLAKVPRRIVINIPVANRQLWRFWRRRLQQKNIRYLCNFNFH